jgi:hypothetical protein
MTAKINVWLREGLLLFLLTALSYGCDEPESHGENQPIAQNPNPVSGLPTTGGMTIGADAGAALPSAGLEAGVNIGPNNPRGDAASTAPIEAGVTAPIDAAGTTPVQTDAAGSAGPDGGAMRPDPGFPDKDFSNPVVPCEKGKLMGSEVIIMGDSFYALSGQIQRNLETLARTAGAPAPYRAFAVTGATLRGSGQIPGQYDRALRGGPVKLVIMDGGGNDQYTSYCTQCPGIVDQLFSHMAENGTTDVLYTFYPDPGNPIGSASFKPFHDMLRLTIREACVKQTALRCHFLDLRPFWMAGDTSDGLHPTASGARHVADAIWAFMQKDCLAQ